MHIYEGTWEEIKRHEAKLSGHKLRVIVDPVEPPNTIRDAAHLEELLLQGINSGPGIEVNAQYWEDMEAELDTRATLRNRTRSANA